MNCSMNKCVFEKMNTFREHDQFTDATFIIDGARLKAHKIVLSCRSDVFEVMFTSPMTEAVCGEVVITDASKVVFEWFLNYIYLNKFDSKLFEAHYEEMLYLAEKYFVEGLRYRCVMEIEELVASGNLVYMLKVADSYNIKSLAKKAVDVIFDHNDELVENNELEELSKEFKLTNIVLYNLPPATVSMNWSGALVHYSRIQHALKQNFTIRNNGNIIHGRVELWYASKSLHMYISLMANDSGWDRPLEMSYRVSVSTSMKGVIHSSEGDHWWPTHPGTCDDDSYCDISKAKHELRRALCDFEYDPDGSTEPKDALTFTVVLTQWDRPNRVLKKLVDPGDSVLSKPPPSGEHPESSITPSAVDVVKFYSTAEKPFVKRITRPTYEKLRRHWSTRAMPKDADVNLSLISAARQYSCTDLQHHCETVMASKLTDNDAVETLILANEMSLRVLYSKSVEFIDLHHLKVMATNSWNSLENHPNLVASILRKVLTKPPDFEPVSKEPYVTFTLPDDDSDDDEDIDYEDNFYLGGGFLSTDTSYDDEYY